MSNAILHEPELSALCMWGGRHDRSVCSRAEARKAWDLCRILEPLSDTNNYREVWFSIGRGSIDDWQTYEEYKEDAEMDGLSPTREEWLREWKGWFPQERYWHVLQVNEDRGWLAVAVDNRTLVEVPPEEDRCEDGYREGVLSRLAKAAEEAVRAIACGEYAPMLERSLPMDRRYGLIKRSDFWEATGSAEWLGRGDMGNEEAESFARELRKQPDAEGIGRIDGLTAGRYFAALKVAYESTGRRNDRDWFGLPAEDGRAWYARFGDARDHSLLEVDPDSAEAFSDWFGRKRAFLDHNFEIFLGRGCSRVHCTPSFDEKGWFLRLSGLITWHAADMARVWRAMNDAGLPTFVYEAEMLADALVGDDTILIVPSHESADYVSGEHFGHQVVTALHLPEEGRDKVIEASEWQPIEVAKLRHANEERARLFGEQRDQEGARL